MAERYDTAIRQKAARYAAAAAALVAPSAPVPQVNLSFQPRVPQVRQAPTAAAQSRPSSANVPRQRATQPDLFGDGSASNQHLRRVQSASVIRREQRRAAAVQAAIATVSRPASANRSDRAAAATAASLQASNIRAAAYAPSEVVSAVPAEHRITSRMPIFTGHLLPAGDRDHGFTLQDDGIMALHELANGAARPRSAKATSVTAEGWRAQLQRPRSAGPRSEVWRAAPGAPAGGLSGEAGDAEYDIGSPTFSPPPMPSSPPTVPDDLARWSLPPSARAAAQAEAEEASRRETAAPPATAAPPPAPPPAPPAAGRGPSPPPFTPKHLPPGLPPGARPVVLPTSSHTPSRGQSLAPSRGPSRPSSAAPTSPTRGPTSPTRGSSRGASRPSSASATRNGLASPPPSMRPTSAARGGDGGVSPERAKWEMAEFPTRASAALDPLPLRLSHPCFDPPRVSLRLLASPRVSLRLLASPRVSLRLLASPRVSFRLLASPRVSFRLLASPCSPSQC